MALSKKELGKKNKAKKAKAEKLSKRSSTKSSSEPPEIFNYFFLFLIRADKTK